MLHSVAPVAAPATSPPIYLLFKIVVYEEIAIRNRSMPLGNLRWVRCAERRRPKLLYLDSLLRYTFRVYPRTIIALQPDLMLQLAESTVGIGNLARKCFVDQP
jgi:hypothetical protein